MLTNIDTFFKSMQYVEVIINYFYYFLIKVVQSIITFQIQYDNQRSFEIKNWEIIVLIHIKIYTYFIFKKYREYD